MHTFYTSVLTPCFVDILTQIQIETHATITKVRTLADANENQRRIFEEKLRKERNNKIHTEVITSHKKNVEIDWTWQELEEKEDCEELARVSVVVIIILVFSNRISKFKKRLADRLSARRRSLFRASSIS